MTLLISKLWVGWTVCLGSQLSWEVEKNAVAQQSIVTTLVPKMWLVCINAKFELLQIGTLQLPADKISHSALKPGQSNESNYLIFNSGFASTCPI